jgi:hypothetical protein
MDRHRGRRSPHMSQRSVKRTERRPYDFTRPPKSPKSRLYSLIQIELAPLLSPLLILMLAPLVMFLVWSETVALAWLATVVVLAFLGTCVSGLGWWRSGRPAGLLLTPARIGIGLPMAYLALSAPAECEGDTCTLYGNPEIVTLLGMAWVGLVACSVIGLILVERRAARSSPSSAAARNR